MNYAPLRARDLGFYLIIKEKGEILFRPYCHFPYVTQILQGLEGMVPFGHVPQYYDSEIKKKALRDSDFGSYDDILGLLKDSLEKYPYVQKCVTDILNCIIKKS